MHGLHRPGPIRSGLIISTGLLVTVAGAGATMCGDLHPFTAAGIVPGITDGEIITEITTVDITTAGIGEADTTEVTTEDITIGTHPITEEDIRIGADHMLRTRHPATEITTKLPVANIITAVQPDKPFQGVQHV